MWSLGCVMTKMICGYLPFSGGSEFDLVSYLPWSICQLLACACGTPCTSHMYDEMPKACLASSCIF